MMQTSQVCVCESECVRAQFDTAASVTAALPWQTSAQFPKFNLHSLTGTRQARRGCGRGRGGGESQRRSGSVGRHVTAACYSHNEAERRRRRQESRRRRSETEGGCGKLRAQRKKFPHSDREEEGWGWMERGTKTLPAAGSHQLIQQRKHTEGI